MSSFADLHTHTCFSDSSSSPQEVVQEASKAGLTAIAITDHDTVEGILPAQSAATQVSLEVIPGVELSSSQGGCDIHVLGYFMNLKDKSFQTALQRIQEMRLERIQVMVEKLNQMGIPIHSKDVLSLTQSRAVGRPHLAQALVARGFVASIQEAFERYIGDQGPAYSSDFKQGPHDAIQLIRSSGGVAVLAHPMVTHRDELIAGFVEAGLQGIEVYYPNFPKSTITYYEQIAQKYHLIKTGGSDYHGKFKENTFLGKQKVPYEVVEELRQASRGAGDS